MTAITRAFKELRREGYFARQDFSCCQSCATAMIPDGVENYVFYHAQDADDLRDDGECYLAWGGDGAKIVGILNAHGIATEWDGSAEHRIKMRPPR